MLKADYMMFGVTNEKTSPKLRRSIITILVINTNVEHQ